MLKMFLGIAISQECVLKNKIAYHKLVDTSVLYLRRLLSYTRGLPYPGMTFPPHFNLFICLGFYIAFNTVQVISRWVVGRAEETSTYSSLGLCTVNCRPMVSNYQLSHLRPSRGSNPSLRGGRRECYHSATVAPHHTSSTCTSPK